MRLHLRSSRLSSGMPSWTFCLRRFVQRRFQLRAPHDFIVCSFVHARQTIPCDPRSSMGERPRVLTQRDCNTTCKVRRNSFKPVGKTLTQCRRERCATAFKRRLIHPPGLTSECVNIVQAENGRLRVCYFAQASVDCQFARRWCDAGDAPQLRSSSRESWQINAAGCVWRSDTPPLRSSRSIDQPIEWGR